MKKTMRLLSMLLGIGGIGMLLLAGAVHLSIVLYKRMTTARVVTTIHGMDIASLVPRWECIGERERAKLDRVVRPLLQE